MYEAKRIKLKGEIEKSTFIAACFITLFSAIYRTSGEKTRKKYRRIKQYSQSKEKHIKNPQDRHLSGSVGGLVTLDLMVLSSSPMLGKQH